VVAVFQQGRFIAGGGSVDPGYATSQDGGRRWITGNLPGLTVAVGGIFERATDPVVAIGPDGSVYAQTLGFDGNLVDGTSQSAVMVQRSDDGGLTFGAPVLVQDDVSTTLFNDKNWIAVDTFPASPHYGRVYSAWVRREDPALNWREQLRYSDDRGETWGPLVTASSSALGAFTIGAQPLVQPNGDVTIVYNAFLPPPSRLLAQTSHDGGDHFGPPVTIATAEGLPVPGMRTGRDDLSTFPGAAVDPVDGELYVVWPDARFRSDGQNDIVMSVSTDGGARWGAPTAVSAGRRSRLANRFTPAVAAYAEHVHVAYRSVRVRDGVPPTWACATSSPRTTGRRSGTSAGSGGAGTWISRPSASPERAPGGSSSATTWASPPRRTPSTRPGACRSPSEAPGRSTRRRSAPHCSGRWSIALYPCSM
jgi:hypothetical protein